MLNKRPRVLNFDDSILKQKDLVSRHKPDIIDLKDLGPAARFWMNKRCAGEVRRRIKGSARDTVTFLGSGDFHHITSILLEEFDEPITLINFDFHPDWTTATLRLNCGSWVTEAMKRANISKCILVGTSSDDISSFSIQMGNFGVLRDDRLEIYAYSHRPSVVFLRNIPQNISLKVKQNPFFKTVYWTELKDKNLTEFFLHVLRRLPTKKVYISIDKDCLSAEYALTNWTEGRFSLEELLLVLRLVRDNLDIVGVDITGDYSKAKVCGIAKKAISYMNHPRGIKALDYPDSYITGVNERTNLKLLELFS